jgi:hypothetical protein
MGYFLVLGFGYPVLLRTGFFILPAVSYPRIFHERQPNETVDRTTP